VKTDDRTKKQSNKKPGARLEGDLLELRISGIDAEGIGFTTYEGVTYHVAGGFPTERVMARLTHVSRQRPVIHAVTREVVHGHRDRRGATCRHHESHDQGSCTGCPLMPLMGNGRQSFLSLAQEWGLGSDIRPTATDQRPRRSH
jgi:hypothetical protein